MQSMYTAITMHFLTWKFFLCFQNPARKHFVPGERVVSYPRVVEHRVFVLRIVLRRLNLFVVTTMWHTQTNVICVRQVVIIGKTIGWSIKVLVVSKLCQFQFQYQETTHTNLIYKTIQKLYYKLRIQTLFTFFAIPKKNKNLVFRVRNERLINTYANKE